MNEQEKVNETVEETEKKGGDKKVKQEKKEGFFTKVGGWIKRHKEGLISFGVGVGVGTGGAIGAAEFAKRNRAKKAQQAYIPDEVSPLSPNVDEM